MSYHDRKLIAATGRARKRKGLFHMMIRGAQDITFRPSSPHIKFGSVADDWRSVGDDLRSVMKQLDACE